MRGGFVKVIVLAIHRGGNDVIAVEFELIVVGQNTGVEQALGRAIGVNAAVDRAVKDFILGHGLCGAGIGA